MWVSAGARSVHPHVCGEHEAGGWQGSHNRGSSPRVWGTCSLIITNGASSAVHPHVCGEHVVVVGDERDGGRFIPTCVGNIFGDIVAGRSPVGSSPRVWGTYSRRPCSGLSVPVHPHVCGEHARSDASGRHRGRFIPTCVGNISPKCWKNLRTAVHPHVCGEHLFQHEFLFSNFGSSPRVWGTCGGSLRSRLLVRFIPTCVGNIQNFGGRAFVASVHPHVCGEHSTGRRQKIYMRRFIPTCVGNIPSARLLPASAAVHPHVCGEHALFVCFNLFLRRFIPTCVGNI